MEDITDADNLHAKRVCKDFEKNWRILWFVCSKWYFIVNWCIWTDPTRFLLAPGLAWAAALKKKTNVKIGLLTDIDML